jgi:hypothetical protein
VIHIQEMVDAGYNVLDFTSQFRESLKAILIPDNPEG